MSNEIIEENQNEILLKEYEEKLALAVSTYKDVSQKLPFAFDSYDEECIKDEMNIFRDEVKSWRKKIDELKATKNVI